MSCRRNFADTTLSVNFESSKNPRVSLLVFTSSDSEEMTCSTLECACWMQKDGDSKSKSSNIIVHNYHDFFVRIISYFGKICPIKHGSHDTT